MSFENVNESGENEKIGRRLEDKVLYNPDGSPLVINKAARKALLILRKKYPELEEVVVKNPGAEYEMLYYGDTGTTYFSLRKAEINVPSSSESIYKTPHISEKSKKERWAKLIGIPSEQMTIDMIAVFGLVHELGHCLEYKQKGYWRYRRDSSRDYGNFEKKRKELGKLIHDPELLEEKLREEYGNIPVEKRADEFAVNFFKEHMELFDPNINPDLGEWQNGPKAWETWGNGRMSKKHGRHSK